MYMCMHPVVTHHAHVPAVTGPEARFGIPIVSATGNKTRMNTKTEFEPSD